MRSVAIVYHPNLEGVPGLRDAPPFLRIIDYRLSLEATKQMEKTAGLTIVCFETLYYAAFFSFGIGKVHMRKISKNGMRRVD